ncbi:MAG TPA: recombinase family protein [Bryobacteraceae bacterium]|jgi:site-specific DNA recombinase|nr:recombinase family protein [Bryobacteraceae bacterium]
MKRNSGSSTLAIGYIRVSTVQQSDHGVSLEAQEERLRAYCTVAGLSLVNVLCESAVSGSVPLSERPAGIQLLAAVKRDVTHVVTLKLDRLFRDAEDALRQTRLWDKDGVALHLIDFNGAAISSGSAMGRMMLTMLAGFAEFERNLIAERTSAALSHKKRHLQVFNHEPFGFRRQGVALVMIPEEQAIVSRVKQLRAAGVSLAGIAGQLNDAGVNTKRTGGKWHPSTIKNVLDSTMHA